MDGSRVNPGGQNVKSFPAESQEQAGRRAIDWRNLQPVAYVMERVLGDGRRGPKGEPRPRHDFYSATGRLIALAIAKRLDPKTGRWAMSLADIAARTGLDLKTVWRVGGREVWDGPAPLFKRAWRQVGNKRSCGDFELIRNPQHFAPARDQVRAKKQAQVRHRLGRPGSGRPQSLADQAAREELSRRRFALQTRLTAGELSQAEYDRAVAELERPVLAAVGGRLASRKGG